MENLFWLALYLVVGAGLLWTLFDLFRMMHRIAELSKALVDCAEVFERYGRLHRAKGTADGDRKAMSNESMAKGCRQAVAEHGTKVW